MGEHISNTAAVATNEPNHTFRENYKVAVSLRLYYLMVINGMNKIHGEKCVVFKNNATTCRTPSNFQDRNRSFHALTYSLSFQNTLHQSNSIWILVCLKIS